MTEIIPAVLENSFEGLQEKVAVFSQVSKMVQIDFCDGKFVETVSWPMSPYDRISTDAILNEENGLPYWESVDFEFDLMVMRAHENFDFYVRLGARRIIFHVEAEGNEVEFKEFLESIDMYTRDHVEIGLAFNTTTSIQSIMPFVSLVDFVQCMGVEFIGMQGQPFDDRVIDQITTLRTMYPELIISVDGSVNETTAPLLVNAGANRLVVGSALITSYDMRATMRELQNL